MIYIGIDPGITGAIGVLLHTSSGSIVLPQVHDLPVVQAGRGKVKNEVSGPLLADLLRGIVGPHVGVQVLLERTSAMPGQGVASMFSMGVSRGVILGVVGALGYPITEATPSAWKAWYGLAGADKDMSRRKALELYPALAPMLARAKDHNRAEAILLARYSMSIRSETT